MAFPPRPGMVPPPGMVHAPPPGMPVYGMIPIPPGAPPPNMVPPGGGPPRFPPNMPGQPFRPNHMQRPPPDIVAPPVAPAGSQAVTVFVGNITERAQDGMVRHLLNTCGPVLSWKRVQGATGKLQAFGFCEYGNPDAALRAIRILHDWEVGDKKLVVKVDAKTKDVLDEYRKKRIRAITGKSPPPDNDDKDSNEKQDAIFMDADVKHEDRMTQDRIKAILHDHDQEMANYIPPEKKKVKKQPYSNVGPDGEVVRTGPKESLDDVEMEDGKRDIIHREIDKFRETMLIREKEKEEEKKKLEERESKDDGRDEKRDRRRDKERDSRERGSRRSHKRSPTRSRSKEGSRSPMVVGVVRNRDQRSRSKRNRSRSRDRSRSRERELKERERERERERDKEKEREREREYERERRERSRDRERNRRDKSTKEIWKEQDMEDEERDRKKAERKARDKETSYQERLRKWELREQRMQSDYKKDKSKELKRIEDIEREAKKLREFLEDYDDDRDDEKYYKNEKLDRRMNDREREAVKDAEDRRLEREEIEELRLQIVKEGHGDPNAELERRMTLQGAMDNAVRGSNGLLNPIPSSVLAGQSANQNGLHSSEVEIIEPDIVHLSPPRVPLPPGNTMKTDKYGDSTLNSIVPPASVQTNNELSSGNQINIAEPYAQRGDMNQESSDAYNNQDCDDHDDYQDAPPSPDDETDQNTSPPKNSASSGFKPIGVPSISLMPVPAPSSKTVASKEDSSHSNKSVFSVSSGRKKMDVKDVFNQDDDETPSHVNKRNRKGVPSPTKKLSSKDATRMSSEEKRKHIKSLIDKIPTDKTALFQYPIEWDLVDNPLMEKRIRPWVNKKISEYIGEPEPTLTDFICSKVLAGSPPDAVLEDVRMVLDEEADVFVVKMWRLLIYEIESKKFKAAAGAESTGGAGTGSTTTSGGN